MRDITQDAYPNDPEQGALAVIAAADLPDTTLAGYTAALRDAGCFRDLTHPDAVAVAQAIARTVEIEYEAPAALLNTARDVLTGAGHWHHGQRYRVAMAFATAAAALT